MKCNVMASTDQELGLTLFDIEICDRVICDRVRSLRSIHEFAELATTYKVEILVAGYSQFDMSLTYSCLLIKSDSGTAVVLVLW